ncbi:MAG: PglZ domain-containing protein, partial [Nitrospirota bacterium]|nr:PglZ domain-containing protein [Nitrospirota bacterium]
EGLDQRIDKYLEYYDLTLSNIIKQDTKGFFKHPRMSINIIKDMVLNSSRRPTEKSRLWILVFDGMRLDTWEEVVKKYLTSFFEIVDEKLYLCTLPSITDFARVSLLAGKLPDDWTDYNGNRTNDHKVLVSKLFGLKREYAKDNLHLIIASETDFGRKKLDSKSMLYNILIYNLSDDWIHTFRNDIKSLNDTIEKTVKDDILPDIERRIGNDDIMVLTSDHGFIELKKDKKVEVLEDIKGNLINYRYIISSGIKSGISVKWKEGDTYTLATGRNWFARPGGRFSRYSHGGISFDEMVVPGVVMKKMTKPLIEFDLLIPQELEFLEDSPSKIELEVHNKGNRKGDYSLLIELDSGLTKSFKRKLEPTKKRQEVFEFTPELNMRTIRFELTYTDIDKIERRLTKRIGIVVIPKKGKIEIDTSALDRLDL